MATRISVSPKSVLRVLLLIVVMLSLTSLVGHLFNYYVVVEDFLVKELQESFIRLFSVDGEGNIPTWYSSVTLLFSSALLAVIAVSTKHSGGRYFYHWGALALIFFYLSLDEGVQIHEMAIKPMRLILQASGLLDAGWGGLLYGWGGQVGKAAEPKLAVNLGLLWVGKYLTTPDVFYCPSSRQQRWFRVVFEKKYFQSPTVSWPCRI